MAAAKVPNGHAEDGCIEYLATLDAEGAGSVQTRFGDDTFRTWLPRPTTKVGLERTSSRNGRASMHSSPMPPPVGDCGALRQPVPRKVRRA